MDSIFIIFTVIDWLFVSFVSETCFVYHECCVTCSIKIDFCLVVDILLQYMYLSREIVNISLPACPVSSTSTRVVLTHYLHTQVPFPEKETDESCHKQLRRWARTALVLVLVQCYVCCIRTPKAKVILLPEEAYVPNLLYSFVDCLSQPWSFCTNEELKSFKYIIE